MALSNSPEPSLPLSLARKLAMSLVALVIVYGNVAVIFNPHKLGLPFENPWPRTFALHDAFLLTGMFTSYANENIDFVIGGRVLQHVPQANGPQHVPQANVSTQQPKPKWIVLGLNEMLPGRMGIKFTQLLVARHWDMLGTHAQAAAWHEAAKKMRARHNRLHPDQPIDAVRIGVISWPLSPHGYRAAKPTKNAHYRDWYNDETYKP